MNTHPRQLPIPQAAAKDPRATELMRVWAAGGRQHVAIVTGVWEDPGNWGIMLVDLAKHIAKAYSQVNGWTQTESLHRLKSGFDAEWATATDEPNGGVGG